MKSLVSMGGKVPTGIKTFERELGSCSISVCSYVENECVHVRAKKEYFKAERLDTSPKLFSPSVSPTPKMTSK